MPFAKVRKHDLAVFNTADKNVFREAGGKARVVMVYGRLVKHDPMIFNTANKNVIRETGRESF